MTTEPRSVFGLVLIVLVRLQRFDKAACLVSCLIAWCCYLLTYSNTCTNIEHMTERTDKRLTRTGERVLFYIAQHQREHSRPPTVREIATGVGISSPSTIQRWLAKLRATGQIDWIDGQPRTIWIVKNTQNHTPDAENGGTGEI